MKIGIISINMHTKGLNFACPVHTYAFQQFLLANGIESTVIDYKANYYGNFEPRYPGRYYSELCKRQLQLMNETTGEKQLEYKEKYDKFKKKADGYNALEEERAIRYDKFQSFIEKYYIKTDISYNSDLLEVMDPGFDCYICATDVVWKYQDAEGFDRGYFLASRAMENKWKIAYSASRGVPKPYSNEQSYEFFRYLQDIDVISVRENSLKEFIEENSDLTAKVVMDPVLLNDKEIYEKVTVKPEEEHYLLLYYAEEQSQNALNHAVKYAKEHNLMIVETTNLPIKGGVLKDIDDVKSVFKYDIGPEEWLGYIQYADCVITNSFHASCFCILFEKEFYVGSRHGDKITNLLRTLGLLDRKLGPEGETEVSAPGQIDYCAVKDILKRKADESAEFILSAIRRVENKTRPRHNYNAYKRTLTYPVLYNTQRKNEEFVWKYKPSVGCVKKLSSGSFELKPNNLLVTNDGNSRLLKNQFSLWNYKFLGWNIRVKIDNHWFWYLEDGSFKLMKEYKKSVDKPRYLFKDKDKLPFFPVNHISIVVAEAIWKKKEHNKAYKWVSRHTGKHLKSSIKKVCQAGQTKG